MISRDYIDSSKKYEGNILCSIYIKTLSVQDSLSERFIFHNTFTYSLNSIKH